MAYTGSAADRLAAVREAIGKCLEAQQYGVGGRMKQAARLQELDALERRLMIEAAREDGSCPLATVAQIDPPSSEQ